MSSGDLTRRPRWIATMTASDPAAFQDHFKDLNDPRVERTRKHPLINIVFIAVCGVLSGANSFAAIQEFGLDRRTWFARFLDLTNGIPSDDTFARVLARLDPGAFEKCLLSWIQAVQEVTEHRLIAIDGKTLRGSYDRRDGKAAIHMVSAWASENKLSLGQVVVDEKSNEITAIPELLRLLDVSGALVTIDAMGCQKEIAAKIREGEGDYVLAVKQNQPTLYEQVEEAIGAGLEQDAPDVGRAPDGREGPRPPGDADVCDLPGPGDGRSGRGCGGTSAPWGWRSRRAPIRRAASPGGPLLHPERLLSAKEFADAVRGHWGIENNLHWQLDVSFREDECRVRTRSCPGEPECDPAVRPGVAEARDELPARDRDQAIEVRRER